MPQTRTADFQIQHLYPYDDGENVWYVIIETPKGSHNKYGFDPSLALFVLKGVLPEGMSFPNDFGFLPSTLGEDGDPIDVLLLMDEPAFCGCVVPSRLIGVIKAEQTERDGTTQRNDRLIAVPVKARTFNECKSVKDLGEDRLKEIEQFFASYNRVRGKQFKVLKIGGALQAGQLAHDVMAVYCKRNRKRKKRTTGSKKK